MLAAAGPSATMRPSRTIAGLSMVARMGVWSLYSTTVGFAMPLRYSTAVPSPPRPDASGSTTPSANDTAIIASTMLPPRSKARRPASDASGWPETMTAPREVTTGLMSGCSATSASSTDSSASAFFAASACGRYLSRSVTHVAAAGPFS